MPRATITALSLAMLRARLSLRESQAQFAKHFLVTIKTINNWERGRTARAMPIHLAILEKIIGQLKDQGQLVPDDILYRYINESAAADVD